MARKSGDGMIQDDKSAMANMPTEVKYQHYKKNEYVEKDESIPDNIMRLDSEIDDSIRRSKKHVSNQH